MIKEQEFEEVATYVYPANYGEEGLNNLLSISRISLSPHILNGYRVTYISYRGQASTSTHGQYAGQWLIDDDEQKLDWGDIGNHSKQWESDHQTWNDLLKDFPHPFMEVSEMIKIETPHIKEYGMTRYEACWDMLLSAMLKQRETIHGWNWPDEVIDRMFDIENEVCGPLDYSKEVEEE